MCVCFWMLHTRAEPGNRDNHPKKKEKKNLVLFYFLFIFYI